MVVLAESSLMKKPWDSYWPYQVRFDWKLRKYENAEHVEHIPLLVFGVVHGSSTATVE